MYEVSLFYVSWVNVSLKITRTLNYSKVDCFTLLFKVASFPMWRLVHAAENTCKKHELIIM